MEAVSAKDKGREKRQERSREVGTQRGTGSQAESSRWRKETQRFFQ